MNRLDSCIEIINLQPYLHQKCKNRFPLNTQRNPEYWIYDLGVTKNRDGENELQRG